jgi:hypothetical protein
VAWQTQRTTSVCASRLSKYLCDRLGGKPLAINPADRKAARTDNRIQIAAQTLILGQQPISAEEPENATPEAQLPMGNESEADQPAAL